MNAIAEEPRRPGRPKREEVTATQRRRRSSGTSSKLNIPDAIKAKHPEMEFRWVKDDEGRIEQLTQSDDWDAVPNVQPIHAGTGAGGKAVKLHLHMKPKSFVADDRAEKLRTLSELEAASLARPEVQQAIAQGAEMYSVPGNKL